MEDQTPLIEGITGFIDLAYDNIKNSYIADNVEQIDNNIIEDIPVESVELDEPDTNFELVNNNNIEENYDQEDMENNDINELDFDTEINNQLGGNITIPTVDFTNPFKWLPWAIIGHVGVLLMLSLSSLLSSVPIISMLFSSMLATGIVFGGIFAFDINTNLIYLIAKLVYILLLGLVSIIGKDSPKIVISIIFIIILVLLLGLIHIIWELDIIPGLEPETKPSTKTNMLYKVLNTVVYGIMFIISILSQFKIFQNNKKTNNPDELNK